MVRSIEAERVYGETRSGAIQGLGKLLETVLRFGPSLFPDLEDKQ
jgi:hypothetical protein